MRLIAVKNLVEGMVLGKSLYDFQNKLLLSAGYRLSPDMMAKLVDKKYKYVYILEDGTEDIVPEDIISDQVRQQAVMKLEDKAERIQSYFKFQDMSRTKVYDLLNTGYLKDVALTFDFKSIVEEILKDIASAGTAFMNSLLYKAADSYYFDHALNTTLLAVFLGRKYRFSKSEIMDLAMGCFLHDFGKIVIEKIRSSENPGLADDLMREHPTFGYMLVRNSKNSSPIVSQIVNQHHENQDGSGYPLGLKGDNMAPLSTVKRDMKGKIYRMAEICAVANAYDNLQGNPLADNLSPPEAMRELVLGAGTYYNKHIIKTLTEIVPYYPVGTYVRITNVLDPTLIGFGGVVARINDHAINKPLVVLLHDKMKRRIAPRLFDTSKLKIIELELIL